MKAIPLLFAAVAPLLRAQSLAPVSSIDFTDTIKVHPRAHLAVIGVLAATTDGPIIFGGKTCEAYKVTIARADKLGARIASVPLPTPYRYGGAFSPLPDGSFWFETQGGPGFPPSGPCTPYVFRAWRPALLGSGLDREFIPAWNQITKFDRFDNTGKHIESFRMAGDGTLTMPGMSLPGTLVPARDMSKIALVSTRRIRVGHLVSNDFVLDREWQVNGPHLVFALDTDRFVAVNRFAGEFAILDPRTPANPRSGMTEWLADTQPVSVPFKGRHVWDRPLVTTANGSVWYLVLGRLDQTRDLVRFAPDGSILSRWTLDLPSHVVPVRLAISGRDVYIAGLKAVVYRYELPQ